MGTVTITIKDTKEGGTRVTAEFSPAPKEGADLTNAQWSAVYMMKALNKRLKREDIDVGVAMEVED